MRKMAVWPRTADALFSSSAEPSALLRLRLGCASSVLLRVTLHLIFQIPSVPSSMPGWATHAPEGFLALPLACWPMGDAVRRLDSREIGRELVSPILLPEFGHGKILLLKGAVTRAKYKCCGVLIVECLLC